MQSIATCYWDGGAESLARSLCKTLVILRTLIGSADHVQRREDSVSRPSKLYFVEILLMERFKDRTHDATLRAMLQE